MATKEIVHLIEEIREVESAAQLVEQIEKGPVFIGRVLVDKASQQLVALTAVSFPKFGPEALYTDETINNPPSLAREFKGVILDRRNAVAIVVMSDAQGNLQTATYDTDLASLQLHFKPLPQNGHWPV